VREYNTQQHQQVFFAISVVILCLFKEHDSAGEPHRTIIAENCQSGLQLAAVASLFAIASIFSVVATFLLITILPYLPISPFSFTYVDGHAKSSTFTGRYELVQQRV
jgi:hypothetical protein